MADTSKIRTYSPPPGGGTITPVTFREAFGFCVMRRILITFPPGCGGVVGAAVMAANSSAYPSDPAVYYLFDDYTYPIEVTNQIQTGDWAVICYNAGFLPHNLQVVYEYDYISPSTSSVNAIPVSL